MKNEKLNQLIAKEILSIDFAMNVCSISTQDLILIFRCCSMSINSSKFKGAIILDVKCKQNQEESIDKVIDYFDITIKTNRGSIHFLNCFYKMKLIRIPVGDRYLMKETEFKKVMKMNSKLLKVINELDSFLNGGEFMTEHTKWKINNAIAHLANVNSELMQITANIHNERLFLNKKMNENTGELN